MKALALLVALLMLPGSVRAACPRPTSVGGSSAASYDDATVAALDGPRVRVHYTLDGPHAISSIEVAAAVRDGAEAAFGAYESWGYPLPPADVLGGCDGDGDPRYDVYLVDFAAGDGQTVPEACDPSSTRDDCSSYALVARDLGVRYPTLEVGVRTVVAHELFHAVQNAIVVSLPPFWSEGTAQASADRLHPELGDLESFLPAYFAEPDRPLDSQGASAIGAWQYATAIWPVYLAEARGPDLVRDILLATATEATQDTFVATDAVLHSQGSSLAAAFSEFGAWNAATGSRRGQGGYAQAATYPQVPIAPLANDSVSGTMTGLSTLYYAVTRTEPTRVALAAGASDRLAVALVPQASNGTLDLAGRTLVPAEGLDVDADSYVLVVSSVTASKRDNPFTVTWSVRPVATTPDPTRTGEEPTPAPSPASSGCSLQGTPTDMSRASFAPLVFLALALVACKRETKPAPASAAVRIVSVGSANTETVYALGRGADVVAVDTSSLYPESATKLPQVGYQRALSAEGVLSVQPTLVLLPPEGGPPGVIEQLRGAGLHIETVDVPATEQGTTDRIGKIAALLGVDGAPLTAKVSAEIAAAQTEAAHADTAPKVLVLYARGPGTVQAFGQKTPADRLLALAHAQNAAQGFEGSRPISAEAVVQWAPDLIVLPARGLDSLGGVKGVLEQPGLRETPAGKAGRIVPVDDLLLLGFGPRLGEAVKTLSTAVHAP